MGSVPLAYLGVSLSALLLIELQTDITQVVSNFHLLRGETRRVVLTKSCDLSVAETRQPATHHRFRHSG